MANAKSGRHVAVDPFAGTQATTHLISVSKAKTDPCPVSPHDLSHSTYQVKTSVDIEDHLFEHARAQAEKNRTTLRALIESGLRHVIHSSQRAKHYTMPEAVFSGPLGFVDGADERSIGREIARMNDEHAAP
jgi:hypothetical protein